MKTFIIIPGFNEENYLGKVLEKVKSIHSPIIFVDDGSVDSTNLVAKKYTPYVLRHETNLGKGAALLTGCIYAFDTLGADAVIFMDADDQHDSTEIPKFIDKLKSSDVVFGVRRLGSQVPLFRFLGNKLASILLNVLFGSYIPDIPSGFKAIRRRAFKKLLWKSRGYEVETEIAMNVAKHRIPFSTVEIDAIYHDTDKGMTLLDGIHICRCLIQWRLGL